MSDQATYCEQFLKAYEEGDEELLAKTKSQPTVTHMDTEVCNLCDGENCTLKNNFSQ